MLKKKPTRDKVTKQGTSYKIHTLVQDLTPATLMETYDLKGLEGEIKPQQLATLVIHREGGESQEVQVLLRIDTPIEVDYYKLGGILPFVLRQLLAA